jgi:hypothetical protein
MIRPCRSAGTEEGPEVRFRKPGPCAVSILRENWFDESRRREVPVKIFFPSAEKGPFPAVFFSHGLGGSREGYAYLGRHWASHGIITVHVTHAGTDKRIFGDRLGVAAAMRGAVMSVENLLHRPLDVRFCIDRLVSLNGEPGSAFHGRIDPVRLAAAGHSMGATTALACAGRLLPDADGAAKDFSDRRIRACVSMSASSGDPESSRMDYIGFHAPCLHMTSTGDASPIGRTEIRHRRVPFDSIRRAGQFLVIFSGGDHMIFSDHRIGPEAAEKAPPSAGPAGLVDGVSENRGDPSSGEKRDSFYHRYIRLATTVFWDAYLKESTESKEWMLGGGLKRALEGTASLEIKS